jgi:uncharacterized protein with FMN-binding domain
VLGGEGDGGRDPDHRGLGPTLEVAEHTSQQICEQAIPLLRTDMRTAQSARIDRVSGVTFTSEAYASSLQAALDALHIK